MDYEIVGKITLEPAFGESIEADLAIVSVTISDCIFKYPPVVIQVALTTSLNGPTLLSLDDFNLLNDQTLTALPRGEYGGGHVRGKDAEDIQRWWEHQSKLHGGIAVKAERKSTPSNQQAHELQCAREVGGSCSGITQTTFRKEVGGITRCPSNVPGVFEHPRDFLEMGVFQHPPLVGVYRQIPESSDSLYNPRVFEHPRDFLEMGVFKHPPLVSDGYQQYQESVESSCNPRVFEHLRDSLEMGVFKHPPLVSEGYQHYREFPESSLISDQITVDRGLDQVQSKKKM